MCKLFVIHYRYNSESGQPITFLHTCKKTVRLANSLPEAKVVHTITGDWPSLCRQRVAFLADKSLASVRSSERIVRRPVL